MPFRTRPDQPRDLLALIEGEVRERIADAVDHVALQVMVESRRASGAPPPAADNAEDRAEYSAGVQAFLEKLQAELLPQAEVDAQRKAREASARSSDAVESLMASQVSLARQVPDYWQRFEAIRTAYTRERLASGSQRRSRLGRLFGR